MSDKKRTATGNIVSTSGGADVLPSSIDATKVSGYTRNVHLFNHYQNLKMQVFPGSPQIWIEDIDGEMDNDLTTKFKEICKDLRVYESMQQSFFECMFYGCSVKSIGYSYDRNNVYQITEIRNLPAQSFANSYSYGSNARVVNHLMPGITIDDNGEISVIQTDDNGNQIKIDNYVIIKEPTAPYPSGVAYALPCYPVIALIDFAIKAVNQQINRVGAPVCFPQITSDAAGNEEAIQRWVFNFQRKWGKDTGFVVPQGIDFADLKLHENSIAQDWINKLIHWLDVFFNPTMVLQGGTGTTIGASDAGALEIWNNYIAGTQSWLETEYEKLLQPLLEVNGYDNLYIRIKLKRPEVNRSEERRNQVALAVQAHAITTEEVRDNLTELQLKEWSDEIKQQLEEEYSSRSPSIFDQIGNVSTQDRMIDKTEQRLIDAETEILDELLKHVKTSDNTAKA